MMSENADLSAVRDTVSARWAGSDESLALARSWAAITAGSPAPRPGPPRRRRPARWLVPVGAAATVTAVALGTVVLAAGVDDDRAPVASPSEFPRLTDDGQIAFPLDEYDYTTEGYTNYMDALEYLGDECVRRFGGEPPEHPEAVDNLPDFDRQHERLYGVFDREVAATWGFHAPPDWGVVRPSEPRRDGPDDDDYHFLLEGWTRAAFADRELPEDRNGDRLPEDGCLGEAERTLSGGLPDPDFTVTNNDSQPRAWEDARVQVVHAAWSDCMRGKGYRYDSRSELSERQWPDPVSEEEIATAVADVECKVETNLVGVLVGVTSEYQREFIEDNWAALQPLRQWLEAVSENSARVLSDTGSADD
jgi:hypothetical protein